MLINLDLTHKGHLDQLYHVFAYHNKYHNSNLVINLSDQVIDQTEFERLYCNLFKFVHVSGKEDLTPDMPSTHVLSFLVSERVDAYHARDTVTQCSRTGVYNIRKHRTSKLDAK